MDIGLENYWRINKTKRYNRIFKISVLSTESHLLTISGVNPDPVKGIPQIDFLKNT